MRCSGCGAEVGYEEPLPFRCPNPGANDDVDHVLVRQLDDLSVALPDAADPSANPFVAFRRLLRSYHLAIRAGMEDEAWVELVAGLDQAVGDVDGRRFRITPFGRADRLSESLGFDPTGGVWIKDETGNVAGSHKARHLMGLMVHLLVMERLGMLPGARPDLAIASCGNAALAAATVAAAARWPLRVFIPTQADASVVSRLKGLDADVSGCPRDEGVPGDPTYQRLQQALAEGAIPFTCQGNLNGLAIEGAIPLGYEMAGPRPDPPIDRVVVQVGGGALASAIGQGLRESSTLGGPPVPTIDTVQTRGTAPLGRAHDRVKARVEAGATVDEAIRDAATHRSAYMWPWETEPRSVARGILDDETYDWVAVVRAMLETGGRPVVVDEGTLRRANDLAVATTGIDVDHTGSAGLAGLVALRELGEVRDDERVAVLFTGIRR
jgi:threonine synthase